MVSALSYLHSEAGGHVVYRDLKPENILLDKEGHVQVTDFGLAKRNVTTPHGAVSFVGSPEYVAPEVLSPDRFNCSQGYGKAVDWWALGTLVYEMLTGLPPFYDQNKSEQYMKIVHAPLVFPEHMNASAQVMLRGLLTRDPARRLGSDMEHGSEQVRRSPFFNSIDWEALEARQLEPPWRPEVADATDTTNFDEEGDVGRDPLAASRQSRARPRRGGAASGPFQGFSYAPETDLTLTGANGEDDRLQDDFDDF